MVKDHESKTSFYNAAFFNLYLLYWKSSLAFLKDPIQIYVVIIISGLLS